MGLASPSRAPGRSRPRRGPLERPAGAPRRRRLAAAGGHDARAVRAGRPHRRDADAHRGRVSTAPGGGRAGAAWGFPRCPRAAPALPSGRKGAISTMSGLGGMTGFRSLFGHRSARRRAGADRVVALRAGPAPCPAETGWPGRLGAARRRPRVAAGPGLAGAAGPAGALRRVLRRAAGRGRRERAHPGGRAPAGAPLLPRRVRGRRRARRRTRRCSPAGGASRSGA